MRHKTSARKYLKVKIWFQELRKPTELISENLAKMSFPYKILNGLSSKLKSAHSLPSSSFLPRGLWLTILCTLTWIKHIISGSHSISTLLFVRGGTGNRTYAFIRRQVLTLFSVNFGAKPVQASIARPIQKNRSRSNKKLRLRYYKSQWAVLLS